MPGRDKLREIVYQAARAMNAEAGQLAHAADHSGQVTESFVVEHAQHAREAIDKAEDACKILVRAGG